MAKKERCNNLATIYRVRLNLLSPTLLAKEIEGKGETKLNRRRGNSKKKRVQKERERERERWRDTLK